MRNGAPVLALLLGVAIRLTALFVLGALAACHDVGPPTAPAVSDPRFIATSGDGLKGRIAFHSTRAGTVDIWIMNADGSGATQLSDNTGDEFGPRVSPNGRQIAFASNRGGDFEIWVMNADGTGLKELTHTPLNFNPTWSPDGKRIAFNSNRNGPFAVFVMNADGSGVTQLTQDDGAPTAWSPDGRKIAFINHSSGQSEIYTMNPDGSGRTQLTTNQGEGDQAGWSPDGKRFLFSSTRDGGQLHIFVMNADGSGVTQLTSGNWDDDDPVWSPDGKRVAFHSTRDGDQEIFVMNADGSGQTQVTFNEGAADAVPSWTGGHIAAPPTQVHFVANGDFANLSWFESDPAGGFTFGSLSVGRGGPTNAPQTFLSYSVFQCDPSFNCDSRQGSGLIPNGDVTGSRTSLRLRTNTTGNPNFFTFAGPTGVVSADWRANGLFTQSSSGTDQFSFLGFTHRFQGNFTSASASATGSIIGVPISPNSSGDVGTNHQMTIDITRTNAVGIAALLEADGSAQRALISNDGGVPLSMVGNISTATQFHFVANGDFANVNWFESDPAGGFTFGSVNVSRGGSTTAPQTFLGYFVFQCDATFCGTTRDGSGLIPNEDLSGNRTSLRLSTNTTGNPNFITNVGPTGVVSVDWRANGLFTASSSGTNTFSFPGFTHRSQGNFTSASANATGSVIGVPISRSDSSSIGRNHQVTIDITH